jgi:uncharacterized protein (TIGR02147 family)
MQRQVRGTHFRDFLRKELKARIDSNPMYSLRSFAKQLGISPSGLSMVMSGKCPVTLSFIEKVSSKLKIIAKDLHQHQLNLLQEKSQITYQLKDFELIDSDKFEVIKEWYHYAILNLMRTKDFRQKPAWIAKRLSITLGEVQSAIERLTKIRFLEIRNGKWIDKSSKFTSHTNNKKFNEAAKQNQAQLFEKATKAIETVEFEKRNHTGVTLAFNLNDLDRAKEAITKFRKEFMTEFDKHADAEEVYQISIALFPLTEIK